MKKKKQECQNCKKAILEGRLEEYLLDRNIRSAYEILGGDCPIYMAESTDYPQDVDDVAVFYFKGPMGYEGNALVSSTILTIVKDGSQNCLPEGLILGSEVYRRYGGSSGFDKMLEAVRQYPLKVENFVYPLKLILGFKCPKTGRLWVARLCDVKQSLNRKMLALARTVEGRMKLLSLVNRGKKDA